MTDPPYMQIVEYFRRTIDDGKLRVGDRVPPVRQIAETWGVARATADRALRALQAEGLVETRRGAGGGTFVLRKPDDRSPHQLAVENAELRHEVAQLRAELDRLRRYS